MFEYKIVNGKVNHIDEALLNSLGNDGWELVAITPVPDEYYVIAYFKRRKSGLAR